MRAETGTPRRAFGALMAMMLVVVACNTAAPTTAPSIQAPSVAPTTVTSTAPTTEPTAPATATPAAPGDKQATIVFADTLAHLNQLRGARNASFTLMSVLSHDMLFAIGPENTYIPRLAESWDVSADARTYTFHLREGLSWSDGEPFSSADAVFTFETYKNADVSDQSGKFANVSEFRAPDANTFEIQLVEPNSGFFGLIAWPPLVVFPEHILGSAETAELPEHAYWTNPNVTMGPFEFVAFEPDQHVELKRNENYWKPVHLDRLFVRQMEQSVAIAAVERGDVHITIVTGKDADRLDALDTVTVDSNVGGGITLVVLQDEQEPWSNKTIRQGLLYGINRQGIIDVVFGGRGTIVNSHMRAPGTVPDDLNAYEYNPDMARQLLEGVWDPNDKLTISWGSTQPERGEVAAIIQQNLAEVGVTVDLAPAEGTVVIERMTERTGEGTIIGGGIYTADGNSVNAPLSCAGAWPTGENFSHYCSPEVDELLKQARETSDQAQKLLYYQDVARLTNEDVSHLWIAVPDSLYARNDSLTGFQATSDTTTYGLTAADWDVQP